MLEWLALIPITAIVGGLTIAALGMRHNYKLRELRHRERLAMIERGLTPPPEVDPEAFEASLMRPTQSDSVRKDRLRTAGVLLVAVGLGLMLLIGVAGRAVNAAIGVGGAITLLGAAFIVNAALSARAHERSRSGSAGPRQTVPDVQPPNG